MMDLFLSATSSPDGLLLSPASKCVLLFAVYPEDLASRVRLTLVLPRTASPVPVPGFASVRCITPAALRQELRSAAAPPLLRCADRRLVWVGASSCIRALVGVGCAEDSVEARGLLGLHKACLKACKEVSKWTMFCEATLPRAMAFAVRSPALSRLPDVLAQMREAFHRDAPVHNRNKGRRAEQQAGEQPTVDFSRRRLPDTHRFLEGPRKTLVDAVAAFYIREASRDCPPLASAVEEVSELRQWQFWMGKDARLQGALQRVDELRVDWTAVQDDSGGEFSSIVDGIEKMKVSDANGGQPLSSVLSAFSSLSWPCADCHDRLADRWSSLPDYVHPRDGEVPSSRLARKCQQLGSIVSAVLPLARPGDTIVDFCSGAGHVGLVLAHLLPQCQVILVENKEESLSRAEARISRSEGRLNNVHLFKCNLTDFRASNFRVGVALHACGAATDLVMDACASANAHCVVSPCCYGSIKPNAAVGRYPRSQAFRGAGCGQSEFAQLRHGADAGLEGAEAMRLVDSDRLEFASESGRFAAARLERMSPPDCSPKNHILVAEVAV